jgi:hypothetical protein
LGAEAEDPVPRIARGECAALEPPDYTVPCEGRPKLNAVALVRERPVPTIPLHALSAQDAGMHCVSTYSDHSVFQRCCQGHISYIASNDEPEMVLMEAVVA